MSQIEVKYKIDNIQEETHETIKNDVEYYLTHRLSSYLIKELKNPDTQMIIHVRLKKMLTNEEDTEWRYDLSCEFDIRNGRQPIIYHTKQPFVHLKDAISHAFDRLKEELADA